ncbi:MAG: hypothetical protein ACR2MG_02940 [Pyrinomonadaceae bacterium]
MKAKILWIALCGMFFGAVTAQAQDNEKNILIKPATYAVKPKLALKGATAETKDGKQYHKIVLTITNRDKFSVKIFELGENVKLPPNPCREKTRTRIVLAVFGENGKQFASCLPIGSPQALESPSFLIEKGKAIPDFVYIVLTDLKTGASLKSNLVSPSNGETK